MMNVLKTARLKTSARCLVWLGLTCCGAPVPATAATFTNPILPGFHIGLFATGNGQRSSGPADFDWFEYQPGNE